ncbi:MAG TPA: hypothetical protein PKC13_22990 [Blastocatellia bacterium]|nr:hypothetical protein [Blastocatellia bacterium]HMX28472.1 hypothetical protein [Blastocatellia bacterium]HMY75256.1 hypothetical protein [Blastocatellia bacterium]HNG34257.1 hypothetical protein [Blastocatellia bacterium]
MKRIWLLLVLCGGLLLAACGSHGTPKIPTGISRQGIGEYAAVTFQKDYENYTKQVNENNVEAARLIRDRLINRIELDIERNYREYEAKLFYNRSSGNVAADIVDLGMSAAVGATAEVAVKDMLAAALTSFKGARLSFDRNFFREKTTEIIVSKMQAYRDRVRNRITEKMAKLGAREYPFEAAWRDLVEHFYAGTLQGGLQSLANDAGKEAAAAKEETKEIERELLCVPSEDDVARAREIRGRFARLVENLNSSNADTAKTARQQAQELLTKLGGSVVLVGNDDADGKKLRTALEPFIRDSFSRTSDGKCSAKSAAILLEGLPKLPQ